MPLPFQGCLNCIGYSLEHMVNLYQKLQWKKNKVWGWFQSSLTCQILPLLLADKYYSLLGYLHLWCLASEHSKGKLSAVEKAAFPFNTFHIRGFFLWTSSIVQLFEFFDIWHMNNWQFQTFLSIEWNSIRLGDPVHRIVTKTVHKTLSGGGQGPGGGVGIALQGSWGPGVGGSDFRT